MKKFWVVLLSLGLIMAFAMPAAAVELKIAGTWYMAGLYADNPSLLDRTTTWPSDPSWGTSTYSNANRTNNRGAAAYYTHKLTLKPRIEIVEGLSLNIQIDALEGVMSDTTWNGSTAQRVNNQNSSRASTGAVGVLTQENIEWEQTWVQFKTGIGQFDAGSFYGTGFFGTAFLMQPYTRPSIVYTNVIGPAIVQAKVIKSKEYRNRSFYGGAAATTTASNGVNNDADGDIYAVNGVYKWSSGEVGLEYEYWRDAIAKNNPALAPGTNGYLTAISRLNPYVKAQFGIVSIEAEGFWNFGTLKKYEAWSAGQTVVPDVSLQAFGAYINAMANLKPFFVGGKFIYKSGNDMASADKQTGSIAYMYGDDYGSPAAGTLILFDSMYADSMGFNYGNALTAPSMRYIDNIWFYQLYAGVNPTAKFEPHGQTLLRHGGQETAPCRRRYFDRQPGIRIG